MKAAVHFIKALDKTKVTALFIALVAAYILSPHVLAEPLIPMVADNLDPSWKITLNKVNFDNLTWGKEFVFTYGPLSFLSNRIALGVNKYSFLLYDLFFWFNFICIFYTTYLKTSNKWITLLLMGTAVFILPPYFGGGSGFVFNAFLLYWIRESFDESKIFYYVMQVILLILMFFIKFNTGLVAYIFFLAGILYSFFYGREKKVLLIIYLLSPVLLVLVLSHFLNVSLPDYLRGGLEMISGYNEVMYINEPFFRTKLVFAWLMAFALVLIAVQRMYSDRQNLPKYLATFFIFFASFFILYKQAFVREDLSHVMQFYQFFILLVFCTRDFHCPEINKNSVVLLMCVVISLVYFTQKEFYYKYHIDQKLNKSKYWSHFLNYSMQMGPEFFSAEGQIPKKIKQKVGHSTVDVYPWNGHLMVQNLLNYRPRPVFQSYTAYTPYLENLNFEFYNSDKAPEFVFYEYNGIDGRYPLFDEPKMNLLLLKNYVFQDTFYFNNKEILLLKKKELHPAKTSFKKIREYEIGINELLVPEENTYYEIHVKNSFLGKCVSVIDHAPDLNLMIKRVDGSISEYRTSAKLLESGIFSKRFCNSTDDFYKLIQGDSLTAEHMVQAYGLSISADYLFNKVVKIIEYKIQ